MLTPQEEKELSATFYRTFATIHLGDSGMGGNDPQEPVFEIYSDDPKEIADFFLSKINQILEGRERELVGKIEKGYVDFVKENFQAPNPAEFKRIVNRLFPAGLI